MRGSPAHPDGLPAQPSPDHPFDGDRLREYSADALIVGLRAGAGMCRETLSPLPLGLIGSGATGGARVTTRGDALVDHARLDTNLAVHEGDSWGQVTDITIDGRFMNGPEWAGGNELKSDGVPLPTFERGEGAAFVSISPDGAKVFGYVEQDPRVWDLNTGKLLFP